MKLIRKLFIATIISSIGSIAGISIWADSNDIFTLSDSYRFYWFVAIASLLFSLALYFYHSIKMIIDYTKQNVKLSNLHMYVVIFFGGINIIFWLGASAGVASNLRYCLVSRSNFNYSYNCNGQIISTFFGFLNFILWCVIFYYSSAYWYNIYKKTKDIELQSNLKQPVQPSVLVLNKEELPSVPITISDEFSSISIMEDIMEEFPILSEK